MFITVKSGHGYIFYVNLKDDEWMMNKKWIHLSVNFASLKNTQNINKINKYMYLVLSVKPMTHCATGSYKSHGIETLERCMFGLKWYMHNILRFRIYC